jgi:hypothetical protein
MSKFGKFVQRSTKGLFIFIIVMMVIPLVLWGYMGGSPDEEKLEGEAGRIYGDVAIPRADFEQYRLKAHPAWVWEKLTTDYSFQFKMMRGTRLEGGSPQEIRDLAWRNLILVRDARSKGLEVSEQEVLERMNRLFRAMAQLLRFQSQFEEKIFYQIAREHFHASPPVFDGWIKDQLLIDKLLDLVAESEFAPYEEVYNRVLQQDRTVKAWYAGFDPAEFLKDRKPILTDEIARYYEQNKARFKVPEKAYVSYLIVPFEDLNKKQAEPTEDEVRKYYDEFKTAQFMKEHQHAPGEQHREDEKQEPKPLEEVRAEVVAKVKDRKAREEASRLMEEINREVGADASANDGKKYSEDLFDKIKEKQKAKGVELLYDVTAGFDRKHVEDVEKTVGTDSKLAAWAFDPKVKADDATAISPKTTTSKGSCLFRLIKRKESYEPGLTEPVRERIQKALLREQLQKRAAAAANGVVQDINTKGFAQGRLGHPAAWTPTRYFKAQERQTGIEDASLSQAVAQGIEGLDPGRAKVISGTAVRGSREKMDWSWALYLEDAYSGAPENLESQVASARQNLDREHRVRRRDEYARLEVLRADIKPGEELRQEMERDKKAAPPPVPVVPVP